MCNRSTQQVDAASCRVSKRRAAISRRGGFTLVELMVVIVIIIILMGLLLPVLLNVMAQAREARITSEISAMDGAMKAYKERYGAYPPSDFFTTAGIASVQAHLAHAFPRCNVAVEMAAIPGLFYPNNTGSTTLTGLSPAQALVFWLSGFTADPEHPLSGHYPVVIGGVSYTPNPPLPLASPFFQFDPTRLTSLNLAAAATNVGLGYGNNTVAATNTTPAYTAVPVPVYTPIDGQNVPYVYFASQNYSSQTAFAGAQQDWVLPYLLDKGPSTNPSNPYANPSSCQIISAGLDGAFSTTGAGAAPVPGTIGTPNYAYQTLCSYPSGMGVTPPAYYSTVAPVWPPDGMPDQNAIEGLQQCSITSYSQADMDNLTNFSQTTLKNAMSQ